MVLCTIYPIYLSIYLASFVLTGGRDMTCMVYGRTRFLVAGVGLYC